MLDIIPDDPASNTVPILIFITDYGMSNIDDEYSTKPASDSEEDHPNFDDPSCFIPEGFSLPS